MATDRDFGAAPSRERVLELMRSAGIPNPNALAAAAGVSAGGLYTFMRGDTRRMHLGTQQKIAAALGVAVEDLRASSGPMATDPVSVMVTLDPEHFDAFSAMAGVDQISVTTALEAELARAADQLLERPEIEVIITATADARSVAAD